MHKDAGAYPVGALGVLAPQVTKRAPKKRRKKEGKGKEKERKRRERKVKRKKKDKLTLRIGHHSSKSRGSREENFRGVELTAGGGVRAPFFNFAPGRQN